MALAVCLLFDRRTERSLRGLWDRLEERGVPTLRSHTHGQHHPHLSYVVLLRWGLTAVRDAVAALPDHGPFEIVFDAIGAFRRGRVCLVPACPADLVARQQAVVAAVRDTGALVHEHYEVNRWLPHAALAPRAGLSQLALVAAATYDVLPLTATVSGAALINSSTGEVWPLPGIP
ncbi:2'-5' RNA ligase family protein [Goodfellowiella coeruleoviolacea]|uniref:2'-5' RNA ligase superfamily protein n=1 Tax=Goodfellowiella coeruleoviolacea TaxID=334858 RepID=A0AAE3GJE5_9PSEU|nr:2'-5' RNA ligase family protein [Goodfellowiella coeruleoviolacea]MCP2168449.1 2'-5' RNA ligase superfamily protein [Goodfellowiella coeruleoviolacea]